MSDLTYLARWPHHCDREVSRKGEAQPCDKPAVAARLYEGEPYAVCKYHTAGELVPLAELLAWGAK